MGVRNEAILAGFLSENKEDLELFLTKGDKLENEPNNLQLALYRHQSKEEVSNTLSETACRLDRNRAGTRS